MPRALIIWSAMALTLAGCDNSEPADTETRRETAASRPSVFDPMTSTIGRAEGVQQTADDRAAEQRRRIEEVEQ